MLDKDHILVSEAVFLGYATACSVPTLNVALPGALGVFFGSQLPDTDNKHSHIHRILRPFSSIVSIFGHRGFTHSIGGLLIFALVIYWLYNNLQNELVNFNISSQVTFTFLLWLVLGCVLHIIEDSFSKAGIIWFFPFGNFNTITRGGQLIYCRKGINKSWRYYSTDQGRNGRAERCIRYVAIILIAIEILYGLGIMH